MRSYPSVGVQMYPILLPRTGTDLQKWAVIACDQFTSEPEYWQEVAKMVADEPSTYNLVLPEVMLGTPAEAARIQSTQAAMRQYMNDGVLVPHEGLILVERTVDGKTRRGLMMSLDLEKYDFNRGSQSLIRATEGTILDRLPPRIRIREGAPLELPHILVLIDDPERTVIEPLAAATAELPALYDFDLMLGSGHLTGKLVDDLTMEYNAIRALEKLASPSRFNKRYGVDSSKGILLYAVGDGNHSLATAKSIWEKIKPQVGMYHPARYALVEIENVHDEGLTFEPIHRVVFNAHEDVEAALARYFGQNYHFEVCPSTQQMVHAVQHQPDSGHTFGLLTETACGLVTISHPQTNLPVGTLQPFIDAWLKSGGAEKVDYVHGEEAVVKLGSQPGSVGFYLPAMDKSDLFKTVILDGALPRKTFSMGEAKEKRFYMECRQIG